MRNFHRMGAFFLTLVLAGCSIGIPVDPRMPTMDAEAEKTRMVEILENPSTATPIEAPASPTPEPPATATQPAPEPSPTVAPPTATLEEPAATMEPTSEAAPTADATVSALRSKLGQPTSVDSMDKADAWLWPTGANEYTSIRMKDGKLTLTSLKKMLGWRLANPTGKPLGDLYLETVVKTGQCSGNDQYGVITRVPVLREADRGYLFTLTCDGQYSIRTWDGKVRPKGKMGYPVDWTKSDAINAGADQTNTIGVLMIGKQMTLYVNGQKLAEISDGTWSQGFFGLFAGAYQTRNFQISVDEMSYWENPKP